MRIVRMVGLAVLVAACISGQSRLPADVTISIDELTAVNGLQMARSVSRARAMFAAIGIRMEWAHRETWRHAELIKCDASRGVPIRVRLVGYVRGGKPDVMGVANPYAVGEKIIVIRYDLVEAAESAPIREALMAHVLVHEITHVLQGIAHHDQTGIMEKHWSPSEIAEMPKIAMSFTPAGVELIQMGLKKLAEDGCPVTTVARADQ